MGMTDIEPGPASPHDLMARFRDYVHRGALDRLMALYEPDAVFVPEPGVVLRGPDSIRAALSAMLELSPTMETRVMEVHEAGETALVIVDWTLHGALPNGSPVTKSGRSADVLRRRADGNWAVLIDHP